MCASESERQVPIVNEGDEVIFERFTDRSRRVVVLAQEEARMLSHNYIGTEHVLLGLIHEGEGVACKALESLGVSVEDVRGKVEEIIGQGQLPPTGHIPFTPRGKKVLELSLREALQLGHNYIGTEHILLGLIREGEGVGAQVLVALGAELTLVRKTVIQLLSGYDDRRERERNEIRAKADQQLLSTDPLVILEGQITHTRLAKEEAIDAQDFTKAANLRDHEKRLVADHRAAVEQRKEYVRRAETAHVETSESEAPVEDESFAPLSHVITLVSLLTYHDVEPHPALVAGLIEWRKG